MLACLALLVSQVSRYIVQSLLNTAHVSFLMVLVKHLFRKVLNTCDLRHKVFHPGWGLFSVHALFGEQFVSLPAFQCLSCLSATVFSATQPVVFLGKGVPEPWSSYLKSSVLHSMSPTSVSRVKKKDLLRSQTIK